MGIVRLGEREAARISTEGRERGGREASNDSQGIGQRPVVAGTRSKEIVAMDREGHSAADRTGVRGGPPSDGARRLAS
jgi:hypothetical protein